MNRSKKSTASAQQDFWFLRSMLAFLIAFVPLALLTPDIWVITRKTILLPLDAKIFEDLAQVLGNVRIVIPSVFTQPALILFSLIPPFLLGLFALIVVTSLPGDRFVKIAIALITSLALSGYALPGSSPEVFVQILVSTLFILPLIKPIPPFRLWSLITVAVLLSAVFPFLQSLSFWVSISLLTASAFDYFFILKGKIERRHRREVSRFILVSLGIISLFFWALYYSSRNGFGAHLLGPSPYYWLSFLGGFCCALISLFQPWESRRWLGLATFFQGGLLFQNFTLPTLVAFGYLLIYIVAHFFLRLVRHLTASQNKWLWIPQLLLLILIACSFCIRASLVQRERIFTSEWVYGLEALQSENIQSAYVLSPAWPFWAQFMKADFIRDPSVLLESSEEAWLQYMNKNQITNMIIDKRYLQSLWTEEIKKGTSPDKLNRSILSRLIFYSGSELKTKTLKLDSLRYLQARKLDETDDLMLITLSSES